jgi:hypothetical protein
MLCLSIRVGGTALECTMASVTPLSYTTSLNLPPGRGTEVEFGEGLGGLVVGDEEFSELGNETGNTRE